jgi:hypothetical protein
MNPDSNEPTDTNPNPSVNPVGEDAAPVAPPTDTSSVPVSDDAAEPSSDDGGNAEVASPPIPAPSVEVGPAPEVPASGSENADAVNDASLATEPQDEESGDTPSAPAPEA